MTIKSGKKLNWNDYNSISIKSIITMTNFTGVTQELIESTRLRTEKVMLDDLKSQVSSI